MLLFSRSVMSNSLWPHRLQHARLPCPSPSPRACSNSCPLSLWCHPTISSSVVPFSSCPQSFPVSGSFLLSRLVTTGGQTDKTSFPVPWFLPLHHWEGCSHPNLVTTGCFTQSIILSITLSYNQILSFQPIVPGLKQVLLILGLCLLFLPL